MDLTLNNITERGSVKAYLYYSGAFNTENGVYHSSGMVQLYIQKNSLNGGYIGNTLLKEYSYMDSISGNTDIRIGKYLFSKAILRVFFKDKEFTLSAKYNYLHIKAEIKSSIIQ